MSCSSATPAGLSASCRIAVNTSPRRVSISESRHAGFRMMSATSSMTSLKSSTKQSQLTLSMCRVAPTRSDTPRRSRSSEIASAVRPSVPRSITRDRKNASPGVSPGSCIDPASSAMLMVIAGVVRVRTARTLAPLGRRLDAG